MSDTSVNDFVMNLRLNMDRLMGVVDEVELHVGDGNLDNAALALDSQSGTLGSFQESWAGLRMKLDEEGADPGHAVQG
jgi:hypothetical protein